MNVHFTFFLQEVISNVYYRIRQTRIQDFLGVGAQIEINLKFSALKLNRAGQYFAQ